MISLILKIASGNATLIDSNDRILATKPAIYRGQKNELWLEPRNSDNSSMTAADFADIVGWEFVIDNDYVTSNTPLIRVITGIYVTEVDDKAYIVIPLTETNSQELIDALNGAPYDDFGAELIGLVAGETDPNLIWTWDMRVKNRRTGAGTGTPTEVPDGSYNAVQIDALLDTKADALLSAETALTVPGDTTVELGAIAAYSVFEATVKVSDDVTGDFNIVRLLIVNDGTAATFTLDGGYNSGDIANFDPVDGIATDISDGNQRLVLTSTAGNALTAKINLTNQM